MATDWIKANWWFPLKDEDESRVEAFRAWLMREPMEFFDGDGWQQRMPMSFLEDPEIQMRPLHPHRALIDTYEPGQEWEIGSAAGTQWVNLDDEPSFETDCSYRLKPRAPAAPVVKRYRPWTPEEAVGKVVQIVRGQARMITEASMSNGSPIYSCGSFAFTWDHLIDMGYKNIDGSPCGVEVCE